MVVVNRWMAPFRFRGVSSTSTGALSTRLELTANGWRGFLALGPGFGTAITPPLSRNATSCDSLGCQSEVPGQNGVSESQRDVMCEQTPLGAGVESGVTTSDRRLCRFDVRDPAVMSGDGNFFNHG